MDASERVLRAVETSDGMTRAELAARLGLPLGTVTAAAAGLLRDGALAERTTQPGTGARLGRRATLLAATGPQRMLGAVIWTHGRLHAAVATYGGTVLARDTLEAADGSSSPELLEPAWRFLSETGHGPVDRIVLGVPAPFQRGAGLAPGRLPVPGPAAPAEAEAEAEGGRGPTGPGFASWLHSDPAAALSDRFGVPVVIENDANLGALGEAHAGAGRGSHCQLYLKIGERSFGAGLVIDGELYRGASGFAGELAHIHADDDGPLCPCGARGCLSARVRRPVHELMTEAYDRPLSFPEVLRLADSDEPAPVRVLREVGRVLGRPLADVCTFLNPGLLILDAALGGAGRHVLAGLAEQIERYCAPAVAAALELVPGTLGPDADIRGAIHLARAEALAAAPQ